MHSRFSVKQHTIEYELHCTICHTHFTVQFSACLYTFGLNYAPTMRALSSRSNKSLSINWIYKTATCQLRLLLSRALSWNTASLLVRRLLFVQLLLVAFWLHIYLLEHSIYSNSISRDLWLCTFATLITLTHDLLLHTTLQHDCLYSDLIIRLQKFGVFVCEKYIPPSLPNSQCRLCTVFWILRLYFHHKRQYFRISLLVVANTDIMDQSW